ncbi:MAG: hypothetical protein R3C03_17910, partial [Pirellulaceae bacterium]
KLMNEELMLNRFSGIRLRMELDRIPLWRGEHVSIKQLTEDFAQYLYLPRFAEPAVLLDAIRDGISALTWREETFGLAHEFDSKSQKYVGVVAGTNPSALPPNSALIVKSAVLNRQQSASVDFTNPNSEVVVTRDPSTGETRSTDLTGSGNEKTTPTTPANVEKRRFYGAVIVDATRLGRDAGRIATEVLSHLTGIMGSESEVSLEIEVKVPEGIPENVVRTVSENCRTLKFKTFDFESE